jgi:hypothetical protein
MQFRKLVRKDDSLVTVDKRVKLVPVSFVAYFHILISELHAEQKAVLLTL